MFKMRFVAANKSIGWFILAILISAATISMLDELSAAWLRFIVVMTLTKIVWHCLDKSRWIWGIYVSKNGEQVADYIMTWYDKMLYFCQELIKDI